MFGFWLDRGLVAAAALGAVACGSSDSGSGGAGSGIDISGMYQVSHQTTSARDCVNEGTETTSVPYFRVLPEAKGYAAVRCTGADVSTCANDLAQAALKLKLIVIVDWPATDGWSSASSFASTNGGCSLSYSEGVATLTDASLRIESRRYADMPSLDKAACTQAEATKRGTSMPCDEFDVFIGTRQ